MGEETINKIADIIGTIFTIAFIAFLIAYLMYLLVYYIKTDKMQQDHIKQLNEHDKAVIMDYKNCHWTLKKRKQAKNEKI